jgi:hypothetical protein
MNDNRRDVALQRLYPLEQDYSSMPAPLCQLRMNSPQASYVLI